MPSFIDYPVDGVITQYFGGEHGGVDLVDRMGDGAPVYAPCAGVAILHPQGSWGDGSFGNAVKIATTDGWFVLQAHMSRFEERLYDGEPVEAGRRIGYQGWTGETRPKGPGGSHVHWAMCTVPWFPKYNGASAGYFGDPLQYLIPEGERMAIFQKLDALEQTIGQFTGGIGDTQNMRMQQWVAGGNLGLLDCLGPQPGELSKFIGVMQQTYGLNDVLTMWRPLLQGAVPGLVLP